MSRNNYGRPSVFESRTRRVSRRDTMTRAKRVWDTSFLHTGLTHEELERRLAIVERVTPELANCMDVYDHPAWWLALAQEEKLARSSRYGKGVSNHAPGFAVDLSAEPYLIYWKGDTLGHSPYPRPHPSPEQIAKADAMAEKIRRESIRIPRWERFLRRLGL